MKKILQGANKSCDSVVKENSELKKYVENIKQRYQQYQKQQQEDIYREKEYFRQKQPKKYKKVIYKEQSENNTLGKNNQNNIKKVIYEEADSEPEIEESQYMPEEEEDIDKEGKEASPPQKKNNKIFDYSSKDAKRNKQ